jgi:hypothetical protein
MEISEKIQVINYIIIPIVFSNIFYSYYYFSELNTYEKLGFLLLFFVPICFLLFSNVLIYYIGYLLAVLFTLVFFTTKKLYFHFICFYLTICAIITQKLFKVCLVHKKKYVPLFSELDIKIKKFIKGIENNYCNMSIVLYTILATIFSIKVFLIYNEYI